MVVMEELMRIAHPLQSPADLEPLLDLIGDARFVLLGEASHGTREYYDWRAEISKRLITEKGFDFIAVEGDWPECYEVNNYIKSEDTATPPHTALKAFKRWPTWMWNNHEVGALIKWLRNHNQKKEPGHKVGFYGLDVYSLWESLAAVTRYLEKYEPKAVGVARQAYRCFEPYGENFEEYAHASAFVPESCEPEVLGILAHLRENRAALRKKDPESYFDAEQNAVVAQNAEHYYRIMLRGGAASWNARDQHMVETLERLMVHHGKHSRAIVWAHNTHIGDARATDMHNAGMLNVGQLVRERHMAAGVVLAGFGSYEGTVVAAKAWDTPSEAMRLPRAMAGSWEAEMHETFGADKLLLLRGLPRHSGLFEAHGHRAVGVVYHPSAEVGNYVSTRLASRYDAFLYCDKTNALKPYMSHPIFDHELPETYPTGV